MITENTRKCGAVKDGGVTLRCTEPEGHDALPDGTWHKAVYTREPANAAQAAEQIYAHAVRNREPGYEPGGIYQDPAGRTWCRMRTSDRTDPEWRCCESGTLYSGQYPPRPLRKLAPEPGPDFWEQVAGILAGCMDAGLAREAASRICELARGGSS